MTPAFMAAIESCANSPDHLASMRLERFQDELRKEVELDLDLIAVREQVKLNQMRRDINMTVSCVDCRGQYGLEHVSSVLLDKTDGTMVRAWRCHRCSQKQGPYPDDLDTNGGITR